MKLDRWAVLASYIAEHFNADLVCVALFDASFYPRHWNTHPIDHPTPTPVINRRPFTTDINGPLHREPFHPDIAMARVRSTETSSCRSPRLAGTPLRQG